MFVIDGLVELALQGASRGGRAGARGRRGRRQCGWQEDVWNRVQDLIQRPGRLATASVTLQLLTARCLSNCCLETERDFVAGVAIVRGGGRQALGPGSESAARLGAPGCESAGMGAQAGCCSLPGTTSTGWPGTGQGMMVGQRQAASRTTEATRLPLASRWQPHKTPDSAGIPLPPPTQQFPPTTVPTAALPRVVVSHLTSPRRVPRSAPFPKHARTYCRSFAALGPAIPSIRRFPCSPGGSRHGFSPLFSHSQPVLPSHPMPWPPARPSIMEINDSPLCVALKPS